jgi:hypothetical protein
MDLVIVVICCNCSIAMVVFAITLWTIRLRRQVIGLTSFCDRCFDEWNRLYGDALGSGTSIAVSRMQIQQLSQIYQQQLVTLDRVRALQSVWGLGRFLLFKRR